MAFLKRFATYVALLIVAEVVLKTIFLIRLVAFDEIRRSDSHDAWFPGQSFETKTNNQTSWTQITTKGPCRIRPSFGVEGAMGFQGLTKIKISTDHSDRNIPLLCVVVTDSTHHSTSLKAILNTYAPHCTGFLAASNQTDVSLHAKQIFSSDDNEWQRLVKTWRHLRQSYREKYTAFHISQISSYMIPQNLNSALSKMSRQVLTQKPMYSGGIVVPSLKLSNVRYCGGGAGFTLNRLSLDITIETCDAVMNKREKVDQKLGACLEQLANLKCQKNLDDKQALRNLEFGVDYHANWNRKVKGPIKFNPLSKVHGFWMKRGLDGISENTVSFNLVDWSRSTNYSIAESMERVHAILNGTCESQWNLPVTALDENGNPGYVHDPSFLKQRPLPFTKSDDEVCNVPFGQGVEGSVGYTGLKKIRIMSTTTSESIKVLCMIYTHSGAHNRVRAIAETYGARCDGFLAGSNLTDSSIGAVHIAHEGPEIYKNMWLKVRSLWEYAHTHYRNDYDLFHIGGDDHYVIVENLRYMVASGNWKGPWNQSAPLFLGGSMSEITNPRERYCGGGSGYTLNRVALDLLVEKLFPTVPCRPHHQASEEDRIISSCFRSANIKCMDTNDNRNETRYHQGKVDYHARWTKDVPNVWRANTLEQYHGIASKERLGQISESSVSFHLKNTRRKFKHDPGIRRYDAILYSRCD